MEIVGITFWRWIEFLSFFRGEIYSTGLSGGDQMIIPRRCTEYVVPVAQLSNIPD